MYDELIKRLRERCVFLFPHHGESRSYDADLMHEAADAIEELSHDYEKLAEDFNGAVELLHKRSKPHWISVTERLPEQKKQVLVTGIEAIGNVQIYGVKQLDGDVWRPTSAPSCYWEHWMPLPPAPKEE